MRRNPYQLLEGVASPPMRPEQPRLTRVRDPSKRPRRRYIRRGAGRDSVSAGEASTTPVFVDLSAGRASSDSLGEDVLLNLENVTGSQHDDTIIGDDGPNWLAGGSIYTQPRPMGNDRLVGRGGDDVLDGLDGAVGSEYDDSVDAGEGNDFCTVDPDDELISCETHGAQYPPYWLGAV
jgi:Ca2+-binding RTX toxin-like protein